MKTLRQHVAKPIAAAIAGTACGAVLGCLLGRTVIFHQTSTRLDNTAQKLAVQGDSSTAESRGVLSQMNASTDGVCSPQQIAAFRKLVFSSHYLKAAGRMSGDSIACSTTFGVAHGDPVHARPSYVQHDGTSIYENLPLFLVPGKTVIAVRKGDSFVIYNPFNLHVDSPFWMHFTVTDRDHVRRHSENTKAMQPNSPGIELMHEGKSRLDGNLYATHCSRDGNVCLSAYTSVAEALGANRFEFAGFMLLGALAGCVFGLVCTLLYRRNRGIEKQLIRAIRKDALGVVYQPIVDLHSGRIIGAEALVRWNDDGNMAVPPDVFVRIAEERGFVGEITRLVLRRILRDFGPTLRERPDFHVNINIAAADLADPEFVPLVEKALKQARVPAYSLGFEITEGFTARHDVARKTILQLREMGHAVHIDDFGTGFSSLSYLYELSISGIKIDRAFVRAIGTEAVTVAILPQILNMARQLNLQVTVEGIETPEQAEYFTHRATESIHAQGWLYGRPVPASDLLNMLGRVSEEQDHEKAPGLEVAVTV
ncbi:MAG: EAL domain-containing protein [Acidobacteriota bacterium]|nr:EAL domain-containing protein [Acidobacteriota bacterium]